MHCARGPVGRVLALFSLLLASVHADAQTVSGSLVDLVNSDRFEFTQLERQAALANQAVYNELAPRCDPRLQPAPGSCPVDAARLFGNVRELVETANELLGSGPTEFSLGADEQGLAFALRWSAAEEMTAQSSLSTEFANNQLTSLMSRMSALRQGARGFSVVNAPAAAARPEAMLADTSPARGGGAAADAQVSEDFSRWGGFLDGSFGWGERDPTQMEDAFDFDGTEWTLGTDYRFTDQLVAGAVLGRSEQRIDFDSRRSVVDGGIESDGYSLIVYAMYEWAGPYLSASLGWQRLSVDTTRRISYPSFNPDVPSVDVTARGSTDSDTVSLTLSGGWSWNWRALGVEPYLNVEYLDTTLQGFNESSVHNRGPVAGRPAGYDFAFDDQAMKSLDSAVGVRLQYVLTPGFGVLVPYLKAEFHWQLEDDPHGVKAAFNGISGIDGGARFDLRGLQRDDDFYVVAAGLSVVLKHGWQGFVQYQTVQDLDLLTNSVITGGIRAEF